MLYALGMWLEACDEGCVWVVDRCETQSWLVKPLHQVSHTTRLLRAVSVLVCVTVTVSIKCLRSKTACGPLSCILVLLRHEWRQVPIGSLCEYSIWLV